MPGPATPPRPGSSAPSSAKSAASSAPRRLPLAPRHGVDETAVAAANARPVIPLTILDAPTQRLWAVGVYVALLAWKFYDWGQLIDDNAESFWLWLKWITLDMIFLFGLPELRIPWLEFTTPFTIAVFFTHALFDWMLMFDYGLPWQAWFLGFAKVFYDREIGISENSVKMSNILHNSSLIMGRQIINILPEGSAVLNPDHIPFCLGSDQKTAPIPLYLNATVPAEVELIRTDFESGKSETIKLSKSQLREIERQTKRQTQEGGPQTAVQFDFPAKKPGAYQLGKVLDQYKLEVQRKLPFTFVVACPSARVRAPPSSGRCLGELSDLALEVLGTPPLKIVYSRTINGKDHSFHIQSLQPAGFSSPLVGAFGSASLVAPAEDKDVSWARSQLVSVNLNESMHLSGEWQYSVDEVQDAFGNVAKYAPPADDPEPRPRPKNLVQNFIVRERPRVKLAGCDMRHPLKVAKGDSKELPVSFEISGPTSDDTSHTLTWQFSPFDTLTETGDHGKVVSVGEHSARNAHDRPRISAPGLYTLKAVTSGSCEGEVQEPSSCLLLNPLEPKVSIRAAEIPDSCAGNSVGLRVDLDLVGTPPFVLRCESDSNGRKKDEKVKIPGMRHQLELIPRLSGHHEYRFTHIGDAIYHDQKLSGPEYFLEQNVKPIAHAMISKNDVKPTACLGEEAEVKILLFGEPPFTLEWESILDGKRKPQRTTDINDFKHVIKTDPLTQGGEYTIALTGITDQRGCRQFLKDETKISVRRQSPRGAFGLIEHKRQVMGVEGSAVKLPLRLTGEGPWRVTYVNINESSPGSPAVLQKEIHNDNDFLPVKSRGIFQITDVWDKECHGLVDPKASTFEVDWYARPQLSMLANPGLSEADGQWVVNDVCEGDVSGFEIDLKGSPPYHVEYDIRHQPLHGSSAISHRDFDAALSKASIQMDTSKAGTYTYTFTSLADYLYNNDAEVAPVTVRQKVNSKPTASFVKPGQTFKYCTLEQREEDGIPITLTGVAPFSLEMEIKHQSGTIPEVFRTAIINQHSFQLQIPKAHLKLGTSHVRIRSVRDASGCHSAAPEAGGSLSSAAAAPSVQVQLFDAPSIYPLETRTDYCVGDRLAYTLAGAPPFEVWYTFDGQQKKAKSATTSFRRVAELPGDFTITMVADRASECRAPVALTKTIHPMPAVKISRGKNARADIHEGGEVDILFEFWGTPPFEFTYTRSTNARKGQRSHVLETRHDTSLEHSKVVRASQEGTYEVVAIKDRFCAFSTQQADAAGRGGKDKGAAGAQKMLGY